MNKTIKDFGKLALILGVGTSLSGCATVWPEVKKEFGYFGKSVKYQIEDGKHWLLRDDCFVVGGDNRDAQDQYDLDKNKKDSVRK